QAVRDLTDVPLAARLATAVVAYFEYVRMTFWPSGLAIFYPYRQPVPVTDVLIALTAMAVITGTAWRFRRSNPHLIIGWLLYLGMLVPVIGLVQIGEQSHADRYTYIPTIGIFIATAWLLADLAERGSAARIATTAACVVALIALTITTVKQIAHWRDAETLFAHTLRVTRDNWLAHNNYGSLLLERGETASALNHFKRSIAIRPDYAYALCNAADAALLLNQPEEAVAYLQRAASIETLTFISVLNYANALAMSGRLDEAEAQVAAAMRLDGSDPQPLTLLGQIRAAQSRHAEAIGLYEAALRLDAGNAEAHFQIAVSLIAANRIEEARSHLESALRITPDDAQARQLFDSLPPPTSRPSLP
ncbi:MAG TPA: tetratricopeptide repeat protein, partial [Roseiflexaceae bacterium]|nr:tetratricopeptide repeat protein [Roseiflexaceae bacterium]